MLEKELRRELIQKGRAFTRGFRNDDPYMKQSESDQDMKLPQPPLVKAALTPVEEHIPLEKDFSKLTLKNNLVDLFRDRKSSRIYTQESISLEELSFMLWATQGIKALRGKSYATLRTVPCGGARHQFETYLIVRNVEGLQPGAYHYLPMGHKLHHPGGYNIHAGIHKVADHPGPVGLFYKAAHKSLAVRHRKAVAERGWVPLQSNGHGGLFLPVPFPFLSLSFLLLGCLFRSC